MYGIPLKKPNLFFFIFWGFVFCIFCLTIPWGLQFPGKYGNNSNCSATSPRGAAFPGEVQSALISYCITIAIPNTTTTILNPKSYFDIVFVLASEVVFRTESLVSVLYKLVLQFADLVIKVFFEIRFLRIVGGITCFVSIFDVFIKKYFVRNCVFTFVVYLLFYLKIGLFLSLAFMYFTYCKFVLTLVLLFSYLLHCSPPVYLFSKRTENARMVDTSSFGRPVKHSCRHVRNL